MITFLALVFLLLCLASTASHYHQLAIAQAERVATLTTALAQAEARNQDMYKMINQSCIVISEQDCAIRELRAWLEITLPQSMRASAGRWN